MNKRELIKTISLSLVFIFCVSSLISCRKKDPDSEIEPQTDKDPYADVIHNINSPKYIAANDEWWGSAEFSVIADGVSFDINSSDVVVNCNLKAVTENNVYMYYGGFEYATDSDRSINEIACISIAPGSEGETVGVIDIKSIISSDEGFVNDVGGVYEENGKTKMIVQIQYLDARGLRSCVCDVDLSKGTVGALTGIDFGNNTDVDNVTVNDVVFANGIAFMKCYVSGSGEDGGYCVYALEGDDCYKVRTDDIENIDIFERYDDKNIIMSVTAFERQAYMLLDTETLSVSEISDYRGEVKTDGHCLIASGSSDKDRTVLLDFNNTLLSCNVYNSCLPIAVSDDRIILKGNGSGSENTMAVLYKAVTNPNAGKQIIEAAHLEPITELEAEGICAFNRTSEKYFVINNENYNYWTIFDWDAAETNYNAERTRARSEKVNKLMTDIKSGEGPDVILGGSEFREIQNGIYLVDIAPWISDLNLSPDGYFTSPIDAADINGRKYLLPYDVMLNGIIINTSDASGLGDGVKIEDYGAFVADVCNGNDPMYCYSSKIDYFNHLLGLSFDLYEKEDGTVDFDNPDFRSLAEYVYDNVPEQISYKEGKVRVVSLGNISFDFGQYGQSFADKKLMGLPSPDGRGVYCTYNSSASITACSSCQDGCWELISSMISDEVLQHAAGIPLSRKALTSSAVASSDGTPLSQDVIEDYIVLIDKTSFYYSTDYTITMIISEEMPAYFEGQKSLDEVINSINNRVGVLVAERG